MVMDGQESRHSTEWRPTDVLRADTASRKLSDRLKISRLARDRCFGLRESPEPASVMTLQKSVLLRLSGAWDESCPPAEEMLPLPPPTPNGQIEFRSPSPIVPTPSSSLILAVRKDPLGIVCRSAHNAVWRTEASRWTDSTAVTRELILY
jgi:hypothetical protein